MQIILFIFALMPFYLLGAFPTGYLIARRHGIAISEAGSGNVGATNVARVLGKQAGLITLCVDILKGWLGVWLAVRIGGPGKFEAFAAVCLVAGHCFSIPGKLKGGKGVATAFGVFACLNPPAAWVGLLIFAVVALWTRLVSLASVTAALVVPVYTLFTGAPEMTSFAMCLISLLVVYRHKENLIRLSAGKEKRFSLRKEDGPEK